MKITAVISLDGAVALITADIALREKLSPAAPFPPQENPVSRRYHSDSGAALKTAFLSYFMLIVLPLGSVL